MSRYEICLRYVLSNPFIDKSINFLMTIFQLKKLVNVSKKGDIKIKNEDIKTTNDINLLNPSNGQH